MKQRLIVCLLVVLAAMLTLTGCSGSQAEDAQPDSAAVAAQAAAHTESEELDKLREERAQKFKEQMAEPVPAASDMCANGAFAESWYISHFTHHEAASKMTAGSESWLDSLDTRGIGRRAVEDEIVRRNTALVRSLGYYARHRKPIPSCRIDVFYQINVILEGKEVGGVSIPHRLGVGIARVGRANQPHVKELSSRKWNEQEQARINVGSFAGDFHLSDRELRTIGVSRKDIYGLHSRIKDAKKLQ